MHGPFISLQSLPSPISIMQVSAGGPLQTVLDEQTTQSAYCFFLSCLNNFIIRRDHIQEDIDYMCFSLLSLSFFSLFLCVVLK